MSSLVGDDRELNRGVLPLRALARLAHGVALLAARTVRPDETGRGERTTRVRLFSGFVRKRDVIVLLGRCGEGLCRAASRIDGSLKSAQNRDFQTHPTSPLELVQLHVALLWSNHHARTNNAHVADYFGRRKVVLVDQVSCKSASRFTSASPPMSTPVRPRPALQWTAIFLPLDTHSSAR